MNKWGINTRTYIKGKNQKRINKLGKMRKGKINVRVKFDGERIIDNDYDEIDDVKNIFGMLKKKFK